MSATKYWGDEQRADAVYAVYLKKVRYVPPQPYEGLPHYRPIDPDSQHFAAQIDTPNHLQWETIQERVIKAGSLSRLVESLINVEDSRMDSRQFNVFFATFRSFAESEAVLAKFIEWYEAVALRHTNDTADATQPSTSSGESTNDSTTQWATPKCVPTLLNTIRSILICWLDMYPEDFYVLDGDAKFFLLARLIDFARSRSLYDLKHKARKVRERFRRVAEEGGLAAQIPSLARYSYANAVCYDPHDIGYARHRAQMFDISRDNCVQIAEQLTFWDAVLFRELRPYQCQGAIWGRRHKDKAHAVYSVRATIDQFNAVSQRVMTSIVFPKCAPEFRAKIVEKWIEIARELRALKNFSSLKAIVSSLQSEPVFRLKATWAVVSKGSMSQFKQLTAIFDADENGEESRARSILEAEGTAKNSPMKRSTTTHVSGAGTLPNGPNCRRTKSDVNLAADAQGTVPFLGSFLTDLTMIDQAHYDITSEGLINFEKRRREFDVLAKIRLFQSAARAYTVPMDQAFCIWFYYLPSINEKDCFTRSLEIEPVSTSTPDTRRRKHHTTPTHNGLSASPSTCKFHSLTKMFASSATTNDTPTSALTNKADIGETERRKLSARLMRDLHQQQPSSSFVGQRSNDSGIHTEASTCSNAPNGRVAEDFVDETSTTYTGLPRVGVPSLSPASPLSRMTPTNRAEDVPSANGDASLLLTPTGTFSKPAGTMARLVTAECADYAGSEFNPYGHLSGTSSPTTRQTLDIRVQRKLSDSFTSTVVRRYRSSSSHQHIDNDTTDERAAMDVSTAAELGRLNGADATHSPIGFHASAHYRPQQFAATATAVGIGSTLSHHMKSVSSSSSCSSSFDISGVVGGSSGRSGGTTTASLPPMPPPVSAVGKDFHLARVGLDDSVFGEIGADASSINYKCIKVENGDRMTTLIERALEKHMIDANERANVYLVQLLPDGSEFKLPDHCNPFYAVAPDPTSPMLNFLLKKRQRVTAGDASADSSLLSATSAATSAASSDASSGFLAPSAKKLNKQKRSNLLRWSSGYL